MRLADYVISRLSDAGIGHAFVVSGGGAAFLDDALRISGRMKYVCCHHEQAAAIAAEAYARVRGLGLCVVTSGPGGTNAITGVASAYQDNVPMVVLSGQVFSTQTIGTRAPGLRTLGVQEINIVDIVRPITKYAVMVTEPKHIRYQLEQALWFAKDGRPGPVWLDIPADMQNAQVDPAELEGFQIPPSLMMLNPVNVADVLDLLCAAERPLLHIGQGVRIAGALDELMKFAETARIPIMTARNGADLIDSDHELYIGRPGTFAQRGANFAVQTCDVYLAIGTRLSLAQTGYNAKDYARNANVVQVDNDAAELQKNTVRLHYIVQADAREFLKALNWQSVGTSWPDWSGWLARCKALQAKYPPVTQAQREQARCINSYHLIDALSDLLTPDDIVVTDVGFAYQNTHQAFRVKNGQRLLSSNGLAPMGWGLPAAVGAAVATGRRVICMTGDGGLMFNAQELSTIRHHNLPVKIIVLNNGGYLTMRQSQAHAFDGYMGSDEGSGISFPDFQSLAAAHRIKCMHIDHSFQVEHALPRFLQMSGPVLMDVSMDPDQAQIPKSVNRRLDDGTIKQTALEDASPYLPAEEIAEAMRV